jgi:hypothetical protein
MAFIHVLYMLIAQFSMIKKHLERHASRNKKFNLKILKLLRTMLIFNRRGKKVCWGLSGSGIGLAKKEEKSTTFSKITFALHNICYLFFSIHSKNLVIPCTAERVLFVSWVR